MEQVRYELAAQEDKPKNEKLLRLKNVLSTLLLLLASGSAASALGYFFYHLDTPGGAIILINMRIRFLPSRHLEWRDREGQTLLEGNLGTNFPRKVHHDVHSKNASFMRVYWTNHAELAADWWKVPEEVQCYQLRWRAPTCVNRALEDCYSLHGAHWYGGGSYHDQQWTVERLNAQMVPYLTGNASTGKYPYGKILNRYWLSSKGVGVYLDPGSPLWVSINSSGDNRLCFRSAYEDGPYWQAKAYAPVHLNYTMCAGPNMRAVHWYMTHTLFDFPKKPPTERSLKLISNPTWFLTPSEATGGQLNVSEVFKTAMEIQNLQENATDSKLVIRLEALNLSPSPLDRNNSVNISSYRNVINRLHSMTFDTISLVVSPTEFLNSNLKRNYVKQVVFQDSEQYRVPPRIRWETTESQLRKATMEWFQKVIDRRKKDLNVSSFVFRGSHALALPFHDVLIKGLKSPESFTLLYQTLALQQDPDAVFDAASGNSMNLSSFLVMQEREWTWGKTNGLGSLIPEALTLGLVGYPYIIAPGLSWAPILNGSLADATPAYREELVELYLRWLQIISFFPSISFTVAPAALGANITQAVSDILTLRNTQTNRLLQLARSAHSKRVPILRPLWWIAPDDTQAQTIDDQYLVGNYLLVAPLVTRGTWQRAIYLPFGKWMDVLRNETHRGPVWLRDYAVESGQVAHFVLHGER